MSITITTADPDSAAGFPASPANTFWEIGTSLGCQAVRLRRSTGLRARLGFPPTLDSALLVPAAGDHPGALDGTDIAAACADILARTSRRQSR